MTAAFTTKEYDPTRERAWHLSIWAAPEVSGWCVHDLRGGACVTLQAGKGDALPESASLPQRPVSVSFTALPEISTLVPESALAPGSEGSHLRRVHGHLPTGLLRDEPIGALGARCIYLHDEQAEHRLMTRYPHARSLPLQGVLVHCALSRSAPGTAAVVHRCFRRLDIAIARDQRLLLSNTFHCTNAEDMLYYTLFTLEQCGLRKEDAQVLACGPHLTAEEEGLMARFLPRFAPLSPSPKVLAAAAFERPHTWSALLEQSACAS